MSDRRLVASGALLAGRYELQDLVSEKLGSSTWRAHDQVLNRNVGLELIPSSDPRAEHFLEAARQSTKVTDPRFLRVLDIVESDHGHNLIIREWARAFPLDQLLSQSPLPNRRAATVVAEVAEAIAHAHEVGVFHRRLTPHQVLLKQSGAVRVVGLGVASALSPVTGPDTLEDQHAYEQLDVQGLGKLLYACLVARWPGAHSDGLPAAPTEHGRLLRPRQVRAGVSRDIDAVTDRILGDPPRNHARPLRSAAEIASSLRLAGDDPLHDDQPSLARISSPDLLRLDPVIVPAGPPPGLEPPRRRPKAFEPPPPTVLEKTKDRARRATRGDRALILLGVVVVLTLLSIIAFLVSRSDDSTGSSVPTAAAGSDLRVLPIARAYDFDPQGSDGEENPGEVSRAVDHDLSTGWTTSTYLGNPRLGGLKNGVGLIVDLGGDREVHSIRLRLEGEPTDVTFYAARQGVSARPERLRGLRRIAVSRAAGEDSTISVPQGIDTRYVVVWLTRLPEISPGRYRGDVREISVRGLA